MKIKKLSRIWPVAVFSIIGASLVFSVRAATYTATAEAESGVVSGKAQAVASAGASGSGSNTVHFGSGGTDGTAGGKVYAYRLFGGDDNIGRIGTGNLTKYQVYLLSPYMTSMATAIKQANPQAQVYMYKDPTSTRTTAACVTDAIGRDWGIDYCDANTNHGNWFMTKGGQRFQYSGYTGHWHTDVGASGYKERYASNVLEDMRKTPAWSGVFLDNMLADITAYAGGYPDQYPNQDSGRAAYKSFMDYVGPTLKSAGYDTMGNNNGARLVPGLWANYTNGATGGYDEFWTTFGNNSNLPLYDGIGWEAQLAEAELLSSQGKMGVFTAQTNGGSCKTCETYGFASYMLVADGKQAYVEGNVDGEVGNWYGYSPMYSWDLGTATSGKTQPQTNLFQRTFSKGMVVVNADANATKTLALPRTYLDENGSQVTSVTLGKTSGKILRLP
jgi:hypothetical protein